MGRSHATASRQVTIIYSLIHRWSDLLQQEGEPIYIRDYRVTSTTEPDILTWYWESFTSAPLRHPPDLTSYSDLAFGDIFCNIVTGDNDFAQLWIWTAVGDGSGQWKKAKEGDLREDGRRLTVTPKHLKPSWVSPDWGIKVLRNQKSRR